MWSEDWFPRGVKQTFIFVSTTQQDQSKHIWTTLLCLSNHNMVHFLLTCRQTWESAEAVLKWEEEEHWDKAGMSRKAPTTASAWMNSQTWHISHKQLSYISLLVSWSENYNKRSQNVDIFILGRMLMDVDRALNQQANTLRAQDQSTNRCYSEEEVFILQACVCVERPAGHTHTQLTTLSSSPTAPHWPPASVRICQLFRTQNTSKVPGPDGMSLSCPKVCTDQLTNIFTQTFNRLLRGAVWSPLLLQNASITGLKGYSSIALTSVVQMTSQEPCWTFCRLHIRKTDQWRTCFNTEKKLHAPDLAIDNLRKLFHHQTGFL